MEKLILNLQSKQELINYRNEHHLIKYEGGILEEMILSIENNDTEKLSWFTSFGDSLRAIFMNVHAYRKGCEFGFTEISFDKHGWFTRPQFISREDLMLGNPDKHSEHSTLYIGRGALPVWTYGLNYSFGTAGGCYGLSVYGKQFKSRNEAVKNGLADLKGMMTAKINDTDTSNFKPAIIASTLRDITKAELALVQLTLF
jgi:hypothetical protein